MRKSKKRDHAYRRKQKIYLRAVGLDENALSKVKHMLIDTTYYCLQ